MFFPGQQEALCANSMAYFGYSPGSEGSNQGGEMMWKAEPRQNGERGLHTGKANGPIRRRKAKNADLSGGSGDNAVPATGSKSRNRMSASKKAQHHNKVINRQLTRTADDGDLGRLLDVIYMNLSDMNGINLATAFHRVAKLSANDDTDGQAVRLRRHPIFERLFQTVVDHIMNHSLCTPNFSDLPDGTPAVRASRPEGFEMPVQCLSIVSWACATLRQRNEMLFARIAWLVGPRIDQFKSFELSNLLWAYAKMSLATGELLQVTAARLLRRQPGEFKAQCLSTIAWSFATAERRHPAVFASIAEELAANASEMKTQEIANTLWAFSRNRYPHADLFNALGDTSIDESKIWLFKYQELSNTVWAFATLGLQHPRLFEKVEMAAMRKRYDMAPQNIANILWAYTKLRVRPKTDMFPALLEVSAKSLAQHKRQELSTVIWAAAQACPHHRAFFTPAAAACLSRLREFAPSALTNLIKDLAAVQMESPEPFCQLLREALRRIQSFEPSALCTFYRGATTAFENPFYAAQETEVAEAATAICQQCIRQLYRFRTLELSDMMDLLQNMTAPARCAPTIEALERAIAAVKECPQSRQTLLGPAAIPDDEAYNPSSAAPADVWQVPIVRDGESQQLHGLDLDDVADGPVIAPVGEATPIALLPALPAQLPMTIPVPCIAGSFGPMVPPAPDLRAWSSEVGAKHAEMEAAHKEAVQVDAPPMAPAPSILVLDSSCLLQADPEGHLQPFHFDGNMQSSVVGVGSRVVMLRHGILDTRVVLKRAQGRIHMNSGTADHTHVLKRVQGRINMTNGTVDHTHVLAPIAQIVEPQAASWGVPGAPGGQSTYLAYMHCKYGNLSEWVAQRAHAEKPVRPAEAARVARSVLEAITNLHREDAQVVSFVQPDEIFIDMNEEPWVRKPLPGRPAGWGEALKWLSPEEALGSFQAGDDVWSMLSYRLGMLLYCMGIGADADPYPGKTGEMVLLGLMNEARSADLAIRPPMELYQGPPILSRLVAACLRVGGQAPPARIAVEAALRSLENPLPIPVLMRPPGLDDAETQGSSDAPQDNASARELTAGQRSPISGSQPTTRQDHPEQLRATLRDSVQSNAATSQGDTTTQAVPAAQDIAAHHPIDPLTVELPRKASSSGSSLESNELSHRFNAAARVG